MRFRLPRERYALSLEAVGAVSEIRPVRPVPGAPRAVLGLAESRGEIYAVLDLPWLLSESPGDDAPCLVILSGAFGGCALYVPASVHIGSGQERRAMGGAGGADLFLPLAVDFQGEGPHRLLSPAGLVAAAQSGR